MKYLLLFVALFVALGTEAKAQYPVSDAGLYGILNTQQVQILNQWTTSIAKLESQLTTAQQQLTTLTNVQQYIGNPQAVAGAINLTQLTSQLQTNPLTQNLQQLVQQINSVQSSAQSVASNPLNLFPAIANITASGTTVQRDNSQYVPYQALDATYNNAVTATTSIQQQLSQVQADIAATEEQMKTAPDQATVQKLQAKLQGDQAQAQNLQSQISQANQQVLSQAALNTAHQQEQSNASTEALGQDMTNALQTMKQTGTDQHTTTYMNP
jgi:hypothetical protein